MTTNPLPMMNTSLQSDISICIQENRYADALALNEQWVNDNPDDVLGYWYLGLIHLLRGDELEAETTWMSVLLQVPEDEGIQLQADLCQFLDTEASHLANSNRLEETQIILQKIIEIDSDYANAIFNLGLLYERRGNIGEAIEIFLGLTHKNIELDLVYYHLGYCYRRETEYERAIASLEQSINLNPYLPYPYEELGKCWFKLQELEKAEHYFREAITLKPDLYSAYNELAICLHDRDNLDEAVNVLKISLQHNPEFVEAYSNLGAFLYKQESFEEAIQYLIKALELNPKLEMALHNIVSCYLKQGDKKKAAHYLNVIGSIYLSEGHIEESITCYQEALDLNPNAPYIYCGLSTAHYHQDNVEEAIQLLKRGLAIDSHYVDLYFNFSKLLEKENRLEDARKYVTLGLRLAPDNLELNVLLAKLDRREGNHQDAIDRLEKYTNYNAVTDRELHLLQIIYFELGRLYDKKGQIDLAITNFAKGNQVQFNSRKDTQFRKYRFWNHIKKMRKVFHKPPSHPFNIQIMDSVKENFNADNLVFLVGFPRSGTTLLNQILDSHSSIQVLHEKPVLRPVQNAISLDFIYKPDVVLELTDEDILELRRLYFEEVRKYIPLKENSILIDKNPLNLVTAGIIHQIFPRAKFIFAVRHPYDACLSCFMQHFGINDALVSFYNLEDSAILYDKIMTLWEQFREILNLDVFEIRYEQLVDNLEGSIQPLLSFIGVDWDDAITNYRENAKNQQGKVHTPSYSQIVQPLYKDATYRWRRYRKYIEPIMPILAPHAKRLGYPTE